jgi:hemin uptake protein HemP
VTPKPKQPIDISKSASKTIKTLTTQALFGDAQLVEIQHGAETYQLRLTKSGKLILTK